MKSVKCSACLKFTPVGRGVCISCGHKIDSGIVPVGAPMGKDAGKGALGYSSSTWIVSFVILLLAIGFLVFVVLPNHLQQNTQVESCAQKGIAYFKETGSYPRLQSPPNTGRLAEDVARERCNRTVGAFN